MIFEDLVWLRTILKLIHVYLMLVLGKKFEKGSNKRIKKFTYETRTTSRDFCKGLTNETIVIRDDKKITDVWRMVRGILGVC